MSMAFGAICLSANGQGNTFSQYHLNPVYTSPGDLATTDYFQLMGHFRKQSLSSDRGYQHMAFSGIYPLYYKGEGRRFGAIGMGISNENTGLQGILKESSFRAGYAYNLQLSQRQFVSIGLQGGYYRRSIDGSRISTDQQYVDGVYVPGLPSGELLGDGVSQAFRADGGASWYGVDVAGNQQFSLGISAFNVNRASYSFLSGSDGAPDPIRYQAHGSVRVLERDKISIMPTFRYMLERNDGLLSMGSLFMYQLAEETAAHESHLGFGAWYSLNNSTTLSMQFAQPAYILSLSYDVPLATKIDQRAGNAVELTFGWRLNKKKRQKRAVPIVNATEVPQKEVPTEVVEEKEPVLKEKAAPIPPTQASMPADKSPDQKAEEAGSKAPGKAAVVLSASEEEVLQQKVSFALGSTALSAQARAELDQVAELLAKHPDLQLLVVGHSCNIGVESVNTAISLQRAQVARELLQQKGIAPNRIMIEGRSFREPIASNDTETGREQNRRVEFVVIGQ